MLGNQTTPERIVAIARLGEELNCESCERRARFRFRYSYGEDGDELLVCEYHLQELISTDASLLAELVGKLYEQLEPLGSPLLLP